MPLLHIKTVILYWHQVFMKQESLNVVKVALWCYSMKKKDTNAGWPTWYYNYRECKTQLLNLIAID